VPALLDVLDGGRVTSEFGPTRAASSTPRLRSAPCRLSWTFWTAAGWPPSLDRRERHRPRLVYDQRRVRSLHRE